MSWYDMVSTVRCAGWLVRSKSTQGFAVVVYGGGQKI